MGGGRGSSRSGSAAAVHVYFIPQSKGDVATRQAQAEFAALIRESFRVSMASMWVVACWLRPPSHWLPLRTSASGAVASLVGEGLTGSTRGESTLMSRRTRFGQDGEVVEAEASLFP